MNRALCSMLVLALGTPACGWTTYTFVSPDVVDAADTSLVDASDGAVDASFDGVSDDAMDGGSVDGGPTVRFGRVTLLYFTGTMNSIESAVMVQQPASTGVTHTELVFNPTGATCYFVRTEFGSFAGMPVLPSADYGTISFAGADAGVVAVSRSGGVYQPVANMPSLWRPPTSIAVTAPGAGSLPPLSYTMQLTGNVDVVMPTNVTIDRTLPYTFNWNSSPSQALIHIHQGATDGTWLNDLFCSPTNVSQTSFTIGSAALGHLASGTATVTAGGGSVSIQTSPVTGPVLIEVQNVSWQRSFTVN